MKNFIVILSFLSLLIFAFACDGIGGSKNKGADLDLIKESIIGTKLIIDDEEWIINNDSLENISISSQETTNEKDVVIIDVELKDVVLLATGQMHVEFKYNEEKENWVLSDHRVSTPFATSFLEHTALNFSNDDLITEITKHSIVYNEIAARTAEEIKMEQIAAGIVGSIIGMPFLSSLVGEEEATDAILETMNFSANEISNFNIVLIEMNNKGIDTTIYSSFILSKGVIDYEVFSEIIYQYDKVNGWLLQDVGFTSIINSINLENTKWSGTYDAWTNGNFLPNQLTIEFNEVTNGTTNAIVTAAPPGFKQALVGTIDTTSLTINLIFNEWIQEPSFDGITLSTGLFFATDEQGALDNSHINLNGVINHLGNIIRSNQGIEFEVILQ